MEKCGLGGKVDAMAEFQSRPLLFIVPADPMSGAGEMNVDPVNMNRSVLAKSGRASIKRNSPQAELFSQSIASGVFMLDGQPRTSDGVFQTILDQMAASYKVDVRKVRH